MRYFALVLLMSGLAIGASSCGGTAPPPDQKGPGALAGGNGVGPGRIEGDAPPSDARFTIFCDVIRGPNHVAEAARLKEQLSSKYNLHAWHIIHADDQSTLYYGYYRTFTDDKSDPAEFAHSQADMKAIRNLMNGQNDRLFPRALFLSINEPDPDAPPKWNLANAPAGSYWSLQVAAYLDFPERKRMAVDQVRIMRERGIEAYYYHGETISSVCVGAWPRSAVKEQEADAARPASPDDRPLIIGDTLPGNIADNMYDKEGHKLLVESQKLEIKSPGLAQAIHDFPQHVINGEAHGMRDKNGALISDPSFLVVLPNVDERTASREPSPADVGADNGANEATRAILGNDPPKDFNSQPAPQPRERYGHLNSVDGKQQ
jgi:hypothetical protein